MRKSNMLTIVIPVKSESDIVNAFIDGNKALLKKYKIVVVDSGGGEALKNYVDIYVQEDLEMGDARRRGYTFVETPYTLNLDVDTLVPKGFLEKALLVLKNNDDIVVVALDYEKAQGHYAFGCSVWKTGVLKKLYKYRKGKPECECIFMWHRVLLEAKKLEPLPYRAVHLKEK